MLRQADTEWVVLVVHEPCIEIGPADLAELGRAKASRVDEELVDAVRDAAGARVVVRAGDGPPVQISESVRDEFDAAIGRALIYRELPTLAELAALGVTLVAHAGWATRAIRAAERGKLEVLAELARAEGEAAKARHAALEVLPLWSASSRKTILETNLPTLLPGLWIRRRRIPAQRSGALPPAAEIIENTAPTPSPKPMRLTTRSALHISRWWAAAKVAEVERLHASVRDLTTQLGTRVCMLLFVEPGTPLSPRAARERAAQMLTALQQHVVAVAIILPGRGLWAATLRTMFQGIGLVLSSPVQWRAFADIPSARTWLAEQASRDALELPTADQIRAALASLNTTSDV